jgi:hypothetical protein
MSRRKYHISGIATGFITYLLLLNGIVIGQTNEDIYSKKYNQVAFLTTHNSFNNAADNFSFPNQSYNITQQLNDGVRALMIDVYEINGVAMVYHSYSILGSVEFEDILLEVKSFLDDNPDAVITLILECYVDSDLIEYHLNNIGLMPYLFTKEVNNDWPSLQQMINTDARLVIFSDENDAGNDQGWYHYVWEHAVETHFSVSNTDDFNCDFNRGDPENDLFIFNHFVTPSFGVPQLSTAETVNSNPFIINRAIECWNEHDKFPNFIAVDFYHLGNCLDAVNTLNSMNDLTTQKLFSEDFYNIYPNPANNLLYITINKPCNIQLLDINARQIFRFKDLCKNTVIDINNLSSGMYFIKVQTKNGVLTQKLIIE